MNNIKYYIRIAIIIIIIFGIHNGCGTEKPHREKIPSWVKRVPTDESYIYAVGISGKTMYPTHAITYAAENARRELANMIHTKIESSIQTKDRGRHEEISIESVAITNEDLQGSQKIDHWVDSQGRTGVSPGTTYVLIRMERTQYNKLLRKYQ